jgi:hypothetical protein
MHDRVERGIASIMYDRRRVFITNMMCMLGSSSRLVFTDMHDAAAGM